MRRDAKQIPVATLLRVSCSCHRTLAEDLEAKFAAAMQGLAETGKGLRIEQEIAIRDALGLKMPHELRGEPKA